MDTERSLNAVVRQYVNAHCERTTNRNDGVRRLWASRPIASEYRAVLEKVRELAPLPAFSDKIVEEYADALLTSALVGPSTIDRECAAMEERLRVPVRTRLYVPLDGIRIAGQPLQFGSVALMHVDDDVFERLIMEPLAQIARGNPDVETADVERFIESHRTRHQVLRGRTCAEIVTDVDLDNTFAMAEEIVASVCDFLQVCLAALVRLRNRNPVRWSNQVAQTSEIALGVMEGPERRSNSRALVVGGPAPVLNEASLRTLESNGLLRLGCRLGQPPTNEYDEVLHRAMRWFAKGERELYLDDARLAYVTAVEQFFSSEDPGGAISRFCKGFAFTLSEDSDEIVRLARFARHVYAGRSDTSHSGTFYFERHDGLDDFRRLAIRLLAHMASMSFETKAQVREWILTCEARLTPNGRELLRDAIETRPFEQDLALQEAISLLLESTGWLPGRSKAERLRYVFARMLVDACRDRSCLLDLRRHAEDLCSAVTSTSDPDLRVGAARAALASVEWFERALSERLGADFV